MAAASFPAPSRPPANRYSLAVKTQAGPAQGSVDFSNGTFDSKFPPNRSLSRDNRLHDRIGGDIAAAGSTAGAGLEKRTKVASTDSAALSSKRSYSADSTLAGSSSGRIHYRKAEKSEERSGHESELSEMRPEKSKQVVSDKAGGGSSSVYSEEMNVPFRKVSADDAAGLATSRGWMSDELKLVDRERSSRVQPSLNINREKYLTPELRSPENRSFTADRSKASASKAGVTAGSRGGGVSNRSAHPPS